ncbi:hypothetical protein BDV11DRAFT_191509 [Aspergillus similis]
MRKASRFEQSRSKGLLDSADLPYGRIGNIMQEETTEENLSVTKKVLTKFSRGNPSQQINILYMQISRHGSSMQVYGGDTRILQVHLVHPVSSLTGEPQQGLPLISGKSLQGQDQARPLETISCFCPVVARPILPVIVESPDCRSEGILGDDRDHCGFLTANPENQLLAYRIGKKEERRKIEKRKRRKSMGIV